MKPELASLLKDSLPAPPLRDAASFRAALLAREAGERASEAEFGALLECEGGSVLGVTETGCAPGTTVIVE